jgi:hypothetical protein
MKIENGISTLLLLAIFTTFFSCQKEELASQLIGRWEVSYLVTSDQVKDSDPPASYIYNFKEDNTLIFETDVNGCAGNFLADQNGSLSAELIICTQVGGDSDFALKMMNISGQLESYSIKRNRLTLKGKGEIGLKRTR